MRRTLLTSTGHWHREAIAAAIIVGSMFAAAASADAAVASTFLPATA
jgi:hypothetical protein